jgi:hypothetical protein
MEELINYFEKFGVDANTTATAAITIFVFITGLAFTWAGRQFVTWKEKRSYQKSMILILKDFKKACDSQTKTVQRFLDKAGLKKGNDFIISYVPIGTLDYLSKVDFATFLKNFEPIFFGKLYAKAMSKLFELIAQIRIQNDSIAKNVESFMSAYKTHEKDFYDNLVLLRKIHDELGVRLDGQRLEATPESEFIQKYFIIFGHFVKPNIRLDINTTQENVIAKILQLNNEYNIPVSLQISNHALRCDIAFQNIEKIDALLFRKFADFVHFHKRASRLITVIIKIIT